MTNFNPRFRRLLCSIILALAVANALPHNEHAPLEPRTVHIVGTDVYAPARRGGTSESRMGMMGQHGAAVLFKAGQLAHEAHLDEAPTSLIESEALASDNPGAHRHIGPRAAIVINNPPMVPGDEKHLRSRARQYDLNQVEAAIREAVGPVSSGARVKKRHSVEQPLPHDHAAVAANPVIITGDNNHVHFHTPDRPSDHPHFEPGAHLRHHYNRRSNRPRRLHDYEDEDNEGDREDAFIAPPSVRIKAGYKAKLHSSAIGVASTRTKLVKKPKPTVPTGYYRAVRPAATSGSTGDGPETKTDGQVDQGTIVRRSSLMDQAAYIPAAARRADTLLVPDGTPGVIDLLSHANGTQLGSLSVSYTPLDASSDAFSKGAANLTYLIDATINPAEHTTFYMRRYDNQTLLRTGLSTSPGTQPMYDLLVSFQVAGHSPLCATFNPHARDVQSFGLAACLGTVVGVGNSSQAFRYSPGTGVVRPFYGVEADNNTIAVSAERVDDLEFGYSTLGSDSNATAVVGPGTTPVYFSPDPLLRPVSFLNESTPSSLDSASLAREPPVLGVQSASEPTRTLVVGDSEVMSRFSVGEGNVGEAKDEGVLMVFRRVYEFVEEEEHEDLLDSETFNDYVGVSGSPEQAGGKLKARSAGPTVGHTGREPVRGDVTTKDPHVTELTVDSVPTTSYNEPDESDPELDNVPLPRPVINVAYFGDSGRSPPVPPEAQADGARAILLAVASKDQKPGARPITLATANEGDTKRVYLVGPKARVKDTVRVVSVAQAGVLEDWTDKLPADASD